MDLHRPIQILLVENSEADGLLLAANLEAQGLVFNLLRVEELEALRAELAKPGWDILLTDFDLPAIDGYQVIREAARLAPDLPCILVSGQIGEEAAVEALRAGAKDFVCKDRPARLYPAIQRELGESRPRARTEETREELRTVEDHFRAITSAALAESLVAADPWPSRAASGSGNSGPGWFWPKPSTPPMAGSSCPRGSVWGRATWNCYRARPGCWACRNQSPSCVSEEAPLGA